MRKPNRYPYSGSSSKKKRQLLRDLDNSGSGITQFWTKDGYFELNHDTGVMTFQKGGLNEQTD